MTQKAAGTEGPTFCIVDPTLKNLAGHYFAYDAAVAHAASQSGYVRLINDARACLECTDDAAWSHQTRHQQRQCTRIGSHVENDVARPAMVTNGKRHRRLPETPFPPIWQWKAGSDIRILRPLPRDLPIFLQFFRSDGSAD
jgi:hypothetical protein